MCSDIFKTDDLYNNHGKFNEDECEESILKCEKKETHIELLKKLGRPPLKRECNINIFGIQHEYEKLSFDNVLLFHLGLNPKSLTHKPKPIYKTREITLDFIIKFHEGLNP